MGQEAVSSPDPGTFQVNHPDRTQLRGRRVAQNPAPPIPEGADLSMLAAIRGAFTLAAQS